MKPPQENTLAAKDASQERQKRMIADHFDRLAESEERGEACVYTFVPGNLTELMLSFDIAPVLPEINALQSGMRGLSKDYIALAEKEGHSEDVCTYVKCDIGMLRSGNIGPTGKRLPDPNLLLLSYTGCFTFLKWFELLKKEYDCPVSMLHVPYQADGRITDEARRYVVDQLKKKVIPALERVSGKPYDEDRLRELLARSAQAEDDLVYVLETAKNKPSPIDAYFGGVYYIGPIFTAFRGTEEAVEYYARAPKRGGRATASRPGTGHPRRRAQGGTLPAGCRGAPLTGPASGPSGRCSPTRARSSWPAPTPRSAASTTTASGTTRIGPWRAWPSTASAATPT